MREKWKKRASKPPCQICGSIRKDNRNGRGFVRNPLGEGKKTRSEDAASRPRGPVFSAAALCLLAFLTTFGNVAAQGGESAGKTVGATPRWTETLPLFSIRPQTEAEEKASALLGSAFFETEGGEDAQALAAARLPEEMLPSRFDAREYGKAPVVKSQGALGTCWAMTVTSALEAALLPGRQMEFSPDHLSLRSGFHITQNEGGDYRMAMAYLSGWYGPVLESEDPYGDGRSPEGLTAGVHVQEMRLLEDLSGEEIRRMVWEYGPVQTSLYMDRRTTSAGKDFYRKDTFAYYYPYEEAPTHDVLILGWDDDFPKENFKIQPEKDGAYLCQNTWGEDFGAQGIFYVSYEDANIAGGGVAYTRVEDADNYGHIYQTDVCGWQGQQGYDQESCYFANVYTAETDELLRAVGFYATGPVSDYEVYTVRHFEDERSFDGRILRKAGRLENSGYYTVDLPYPVDLDAGERFAVVVRITTPGADMPVAVELHKDVYTDTVSLEGKEGYLSLSGEAWEPTEQKFQTNVCLKAYTDDR